MMFILYYIIWCLYYIILYYIMAAVAEEKPCAKLPTRFFDGHVVLLSPRGSGDPHLPFERRTRNACGGSGHFEIALCSLGVLELGVTRNPWLSRTETRPSSAHSQLDDGWWCILAAIFPLRVGNLDGWWKIHETLVLMVIIQPLFPLSALFLAPLISPSPWGFYFRLSQKLKPTERFRKRKLPEKTAFRTRDSSFFVCVWKWGIPLNGCFNGENCYNPMDFGVHYFQTKPYVSSFFTLIIHVGVSKVMGDPQ